MALIYIVEDDLLEVGQIHLDNVRHMVTVNNNNVSLTLKEYELLRYLMLNENMVLNRESILRTVWGIDVEVESRTVDMHIKTLRQKLGDAGKQIRTIRGVGYSIRNEVEAE